MDPLAGLYSFIGTHSGEWSMADGCRGSFNAALIILFFFTQKTFISGITTTGFR